MSIASAQTSPNYQTQGWVHILGTQTGPVTSPHDAAGQYTAPAPAFITVGAINAGSGVSLATGGALKLTGGSGLGRPCRAQGASVTGANVSAGPVASDGTGLFVSAYDGAVSLGDVNSQAGRLNLSGTSVAAGAVTSNGEINVFANAGGVSLASATSDGAVYLQAAPASGGSISVASTLQARGGLISVQGGGDITLGGPTSASGDVSVSVRSLRKGRSALEPFMRTASLRAARSPSAAAASAPQR